MDKIIYKTITINDNMMLVIQALIDKQAEMVDAINDLSEYIWIFRDNKDK